MLKKLIKHEFKDTMRLFIPMFGFIVVLTPIFSLMMSLGSQRMMKIQPMLFLLYLEAAS